MKITQSTDLKIISPILKQAFGSDEEAILVENLLKDSTAKPFISLVAYIDDKPVGHILFTACSINGNSNVKLSIMAPLAVLPDFQKQGVGGTLIAEGIRIAKEENTDIVFTLGYPEYYPRHGFKTDALAFGFEAPYPIPEAVKDAWMVYLLNDNTNSQEAKGKITCAKALDEEKYWSE